jgi:glucose dehydrogenase
MKKILTILLLAIPLLALAQSELKLKTAQKMKLNTFFSNFSEVDLKSFKQNSLSDAALLEFGLAHNLINREKSLKKSKDGNSVIITSEQVDDATDKYFGKTVAQHQNKTYTRPMASGEAYTFSQINSLAELAYDTFLAKGVIFTTGSGGTPNPHGTPQEWQKKGEEVEQVGNFTAKIQAVDDRHILIEYSVVPVK